MARFLVTAGSSREMIDRVRDWGNIFTGGTGLSIARELAKLGQVDLLTSNREHLADVLRESGGAIRGTPYRSHRELLEAIETTLANRYDAIFMTAAVADYRPAGAFHVQSREALSDGTERWIVEPIERPKLPSFIPSIAFLGTQTEKIVDKFRRDWGYRGLLVKFKLEVGITKEELIEIGQRSRKASGAEYLVANTLDMVEGATAGAFLLSDAGEEWVPRPALAERLAQLVIPSATKARETGT